MARNLVFLYALIIALTIACVGLFAHILLDSMRVSFASEQVAVFHAMAFGSDGDKKISAADREAYVTRYYPSGTKQLKGSQLDSIVESARALSIKCLVLEKDMEKLKHTPVEHAPQGAISR